MDGKSISLCVRTALLLLTIFMIAPWMAIVASPNACTDAPSGLVSWWRGEGNPNDQTGNNNGILENGASFSGGRVGQSIFLDGIDDSVIVADSPSLSVSSQLTIEAWINPATVSGQNRGIVAKYDYPIQASYLLFLTSNGKLVFAVYQDNGSGGFRIRSISSGPTIESGVFTHIAASFNVSGQIMKMYLNGAEISVSLDNPESVTSIYDSTVPLRIGTYIEGGSPLRFAGLVDEASIYNRALSASEIASIYNAGADGKCVSATNRPFDFDGDGKSDVSIFRPASGQWWINQSTAGTIAHTFGGSTDTIVPADYTGDGKTDVAIYRPAGGEWFVLRSENFTFYSFPFGASGDVPVPADFDADGIADAAVFRPSTATWYIQRSSAGTLIQQFGANGDLPVPADYDGDGAADPAIYRPALGQWWLNRSSAGLIVQTFGIATDKAVPGDYTGDGKADVAFWRPSSGEWFILRSEDSSYYTAPFGASGDLPAPGDYDGDGRIDTAVFRGSTATWYLNRSTSGLVIQSFGLPTDVPIPNAFVR